jgi:ring-1,2-phenylacetyl-CoA epoxidase subunit PaaD
VSEAGTQKTIARIRSGVVADVRATADPAAVDPAAVRALVDATPDPELPVTTIGDLGMVHRVEVRDDTIRVTILPTFVGCPALEFIGSAVTERLAPLGLPVVVESSFEVPWSSDRITAAGRAALAAVGIAPPVDPATMHCPMCGSARVVMDSLFGPTQCRMLYYCRDCRQPFEAMKVA